MKFLKALFTSAPRLKPAECVGRVRSGNAILIDVREPGEWSDGFARDAKRLPLSDLTGRRTQWNAFLADHDGRELFLYCMSGARSGIAARLLVAEGLRAANTGGLGDWLAAGWPLAHERT